MTLPSATPGLGLGADGTPFVTKGLDNVITAIPDALTRTTSAGTGRVVTQGAPLSPRRKACAGILREREA